MADAAAATWLERAAVRPRDLPYRGVREPYPPVADVDDDGSFPQTNGYSGKQAAEIVGVTYRQLDYWARTDLLRPSLAESGDSGVRRRYSHQDLLKLMVIKELLDEGLSLKKVREVFSFLSDRLGEDIGSASLVISSSQPQVVHDASELIAILQEGHGVLNVLPMAGLVEDLNSSIAEMYPEQVGPGTA